MSAGEAVQTSGSERLVHPNFMIIGAMRAGTTRLHELLAQHPQVHMSDPKETHHYASEHYRGFCGPGDQWVASQVIEDRDAYRRALQPRSPATVSGESSATYLYLPGVLERVVADLDHIRVIVLLREPAQRAYSSYWYLRSRGRERLPTFEEGLAAEAERRRVGFGPMWHYVAAGRYGPQLRRCYDLIGRDRVLVTRTERLRDDPTGLLRDICAFLSIEPPPAVVEGRSNPSGAPRSKTVTRLLYPPDRVRRIARAAAPGLVSTVRRLRHRNLTAVPPMRDRTAQHLRSLLEEDVAQTAQLTGLDLRDWSS
jgi:Sulfotransferase family